MLIKSEKSNLKMKFLALETFCQADSSNETSSVFDLLCLVTCLCSHVWEAQGYLSHVSLQVIFVRIFFKSLIK